MWARAAWMSLAPNARCRSPHTSGSLPRSGGATEGVLRPPATHPLAADPPRLLTPLIGVPDQRRPVRGVRPEGRHPDADRHRGIRPTPPGHRPPEPLGHLQRPVTVGVGE